AVDMSTTLASPAEHAEAAISTDQDILEYRALNTSSLIALLLGILSVVVPLTAGNLSSCLSLTPIPLVGAFVGFRAWRTITRNPNLYTGAPLALIGLALSLAFMSRGAGSAP